MLRRLHTKVLDPAFPFTCGLEIHTQLNTRHKLFSLSPNKYSVVPNSNISYFDCGLPGTLPTLNPEALLLALKAAVAVNCKIQTKLSFDRKHYFYLDQPLGYQITQHFHPIARDGLLTLAKELDGVDATIRIEQIQLEQDTGKSTHDASDGVTNVDLNRANVPLIELITKPDFSTLQQVRAFIKKYTRLVTHLGVCSGDLETGAMRVDVNVSICGGERVEIKNLGSTGEILDAIKYEYTRQVNVVKAGQPVVQETRGWTGSETVRQRSKEDAVDYRYFPDSELPQVYLSETIGAEIRASLPPFPEDIIHELMAPPYSLELKLARFLVDTPAMLAYYRETISLLPDVATKTVSNWVLHELIGAYNKQGVSVDLDLVPPSKLCELIRLVQSDDLTATSAKLLLQHLIKNPGPHDITALIEEFDLATPKDVSSEDLDAAIEDICRDIIAANPDVVEKIRGGRAKSINFLIGQAMRESQGKVKLDQFAAKFKQLIN